MNKALILIGMGVGAGLMYGLDPQQGNRRRALARDKFAKAMHRTGHAVGATSRDVANRATGIAASVHARFFDADAPDEVVEARVRARLGRVASHPGAIEVHARDGVITLDGPVFRNEVNIITKAVGVVRGVKRVENRLVPHETSERVPGLQGGLRTSAHVAEWSPATKLAVGLAGATLTSVGMVRQDKLGMLLGGMGLALVVRAVGDVGIERLFGMVGEATPASHEPTARGVTIPVRFGPRREGEPPTEPTEPWPTPPGTVH